MIQRIQTLYILLATIIIASCVVYVPYGIDNNPLNNRFLIDELFGFIWLILFCIFSLISVLKFNNRKKQLYYINGNLIGIVSLIIIIYIFQLFHAQFNYLINGFFIFFLSIGFVFCFLAKKAIQLDEDLINSINRLR
tara:strand:+ start:1027 stop:1437 length:411 start_codon:yes stop_codon:yes gene_type:complete